MNLWSHRFSQKTNKRFLPSLHRAEILTIFRSYFERNYDFINSFWNCLSFKLCIFYWWAFSTLNQILQWCTPFIMLVRFNEPVWFIQSMFLGTYLIVELLLVIINGFLSFHLFFCDTKKRNRFTVFSTT